MRPLNAQELLLIWEQGMAHPPTRRALGLLAAASPDVSLEHLSTLSIGQRDEQLLTLREWTFGPQLESVVTCPHCGERLEINLTVNDLRVAPSPNLESEFGLSIAGYQVRYRLPNSQDLELVGTDADTQTAQEILLSRCLLEVVSPPDIAPSTPLPIAVTEAVIAAMEEQDPQADITLALTCPACEHHWEAGFDIVSFFWHELTSWARRILWDVHRLARAYGWSEQEILALSPTRRQLYLEMVGL